LNSNLAEAHGGMYPTRLESIDLNLKFKKPEGTWRRWPQRAHLVPWTAGVYCYFINKARIWAKLFPTPIMTGNHNVVVFILFYFNFDFFGYWFFLIQFFLYYVFIEIWSKNFIIIYFYMIVAMLKNIWVLN